MLINTIAGNILRIRESATSIMEANHDTGRPTQAREDIDGHLVRIMMTTQAIQSALCRSGALLRYKEEVEDQFKDLARIYGAAIENPTMEELSEIADSAELLARRMRDYLAVMALVNCDPRQVAA